MTCNVIVYALWSVSEHDIPSFDYIMKMHLLMKCFDKYYFIMFCFGNKFRNSFKSKGFTLKIFKSINEKSVFSGRDFGDVTELTRALPSASDRNPKLTKYNIA